MLWMVVIICVCVLVTEFQIGDLKLRTLAYLCHSISNINARITERGLQHQSNRTMNCVGGGSLPLHPIVFVVIGFVVHLQSIQDNIIMGEENFKKMKGKLKGL